MAKPPADSDPEKFIIGRGLYDILRIAQPYQDDDVFRIDPSPMPVVSIIIHNLLFIAFFFVFHLVAKHDAHGAGPWFIYGAPIGIGLTTCIGFTASVCYKFHRARSLGSWLIYDKATGGVTLPRENLSFERQEVVQLQYVTTKRLDWGGVINNERASELNLITCRDGDRRRWPMLRSIFTTKAFDYLLKPLIENTDLPIMRIEDEWLGWKITERPYGRAADN